MPKGQFIGEFELYVMLAIAHSGEAGYGLAIRQAIAERTGRDPAIGAVYGTLGRLLDKGLVQFRVSDPLPVSGGRARKCYRLTPAGQRALRHSTAMLARMLEGWAPGAQKS